MEEIHSRMPLMIKGEALDKLWWRSYERNDLSRGIFLLTLEHNSNKRKFTRKDMLKWMIK